MYEPTEEARWHARWFQICMSAGVDPDHIDSPHLLVDAILRANSCYKLKPRHTALVEAVDVLMRDEILNDFDGGYLAHHEWVRRYAEQVGSVQDALAAAQDQGNAD